MANTNQSIEVTNLGELRAWLNENENREVGVWLVRHKANSTSGVHIPYSDMVDELLCHGWIDSLPRRLEEERSMNWISPRKPKSAWSKINKEKVEKLATEGRLTPFAINRIEEAKRTGTWEKFSEIENGSVPEDLLVELDEFENAKNNFYDFPKSVKKGILEWIIQARTQETRGRRIRETAEKASKNIRANQWKDKEKIT